MKRAIAGEPDDLLHGLFGVRALGLLGHLSRPDLAGYLSGLLIGTEMRSGLAWLAAKGRSRRAVAVGSPGMLESYRIAAGLCGLELTSLNSDDVTPGALLTIARSAGLLARGRLEPGG